MLELDILPLTSSCQPKLQPGFVTLCRAVLMRMKKATLRLRQRGCGSLGWARSKENLLLVIESRHKTLLKKATPRLVLENSKALMWLNTEMERFARSVACRQRPNVGIGS